MVVIDEKQYMVTTNNWIAFCTRTLNEIPKFVSIPVPELPPLKGSRGITKTVRIRRLSVSKFVRICHEMQDRSIVQNE